MAVDNVLLKVPSGDKRNRFVSRPVIQSYSSLIFFLAGYMSVLERNLVVVVLGKGETLSTWRRRRRAKLIHCVAAACSQQSCLFSAVNESNRNVTANQVGLLLCAHCSLPYGICSERHAHHCNNNGVFSSDVTPSNTPMTRRTKKHSWRKKAFWSLRNQEGLMKTDICEIYFIFVD